MYLQDGKAKSNAVAKAFAFASATCKVRFAYILLFLFACVLLCLPLSAKGSTVQQPHPSILNWIHSPCTCVFRVRSLHLPRPVQWQKQQAKQAAMARCALLAAEPTLYSLRMLCWSGTVADLQINWPSLMITAGR